MIKNPLDLDGAAALHTALQTLWRYAPGDASRTNHYIDVYDALTTVERITAGFKPWAYGQIGWLGRPLCPGCYGEIWPWNRQVSIKTGRWSKPVIWHKHHFPGRI